MVGNYQTNKSALNQQRFSNSTIWYLLLPVDGITAYTDRISFRWRDKKSKASRGGCGDGVFPFAENFDFSIEMILFLQRAAKIASQALYMLRHIRLSVRP